jgi:hypothetical protein
MLRKKYAAREKRLRCMERRN